jgi:hypothetical protein
LFCHAWRFPIFEIRHGWRFLAGFSDLALPLGSLFLEDDLVIGHSVETDPGPALCNGRCAGCCGGRGRLAGPAYRGPGWPGRSHRRAAAYAGAQGSRAWPPLPRPAPGAKKEPQGGSSCGSICCVVLCWPDLIAPVAGPKTDTLGISVAGLCRSKHTETEPPIDMRIMIRSGRQAIHKPEKQECSRNMGPRCGNMGPAARGWVFLQECR